MTRLAFFGTPEIAVVALRALHQAGHEVALVVTAPDRRRGRGSALIPTPVKQCALELEIRCLPVWATLWTQESSSGWSLPLGS